MRRREFITLLGGAAAAWPLAARAQQTMPVVGLLAATSVLSWQSKSIQKGLNEGGYVEGRNLAIMYRSADAQLDRLPALAADLVDSKVSVIFAVGGPIPARAAKAATSTIPIVFVYGGDPVNDKLVASLNSPGGNVTGVTFIGTTLTTKKLEMLREVTPGVTDIGLLVNPASTMAELQIKDVAEAAQRSGLPFTSQISAVKLKSTPRSRISSNRKLAHWLSVPIQSLPSCSASLPRWRRVIGFPQFITSVNIVRWEA